jgi:hypothetical protein
MAMSDTLVFPSPRILLGARRPRALVVALAVASTAVISSIVFDESFARAGITPASILLFALLIVCAAKCGSDAFHPARVLAALLALGFVIGPVFQAATGFYALPDGSVRQRADLNRATWIILTGTALAMTAMRATLGEHWRTELSSVNHPRVNRRTSVLALAVFGLGAAALGSYLILIGGISLQGRGASYAVIPHEGRKAYLGLLAPVGIGALLLIASRAIERGSRRMLALAAGAASVDGALMALPGSRANFLYAIVPFVFLYVGYKGVPRYRWIILIGAVVVVALIYGISLRSAEARSALIRNPSKTLLDNRPSTSSLERLFVVDIAHTEPLLGAMDAYPATRPFLGGESAAIGFTGPPGWKFARSIGLNMDPPAGVTLTAAAYGRDPSTFSTGLTATLPGELYANAGVPGVLLGLTGFGAIAGSLRRRAISSRASGAVALYAAEMTILFAIFGDYFGQFYRAGAVLLGIAVALIAGGEKRLAMMRATAIACAIVVAAAAVLVGRKLLGPPPAAVLTSMIPVYLILGILGIFFTRKLRHIFTLLINHTWGSRGGAP